MNSPEPLPETKVLIDRLRAHGRTIRWLALLRGAAFFFAVVVSLIAVTFLLDRWLGLSVPVRIGIGVLAALTIVAAAWRYLALPLRVHGSPLDLAAATDRAVGGAGNTFLTQRFATLFDLERRLQDERSPESRELMETAVTTSRHELGSVNYEEYLDLDRTGKRATFVALLVLVPLFLALAHPETASLWFKRWFLGSDERWPQQTYLVVEGMKDGVLIIPAGEPVELRVSAKVGSVVPDEVEIRYEIDGENSERAIMTRFAKNDFRYRLRGVQDRARLWLRGGDDSQGPLSLIARARPRVERFEILAELPEASSRDEIAFESQERDMAFRAETRMRVRCVADQPIQPLELPLEQIAGIETTAPSATESVLSWRHRERRTLTIAVRSSETGLLSRPRTLTFGLTTDDAPRIVLNIDGVRERVTPTATIPSRLLVRDDFGVDAVRLEIRKGSTPNLADTPPAETYTLLTIPSTEEATTSTEQSKDLELADFKVAPGAFVHLTGIADDRCHLGAQTGRSRSRVLRIVEPQQLLREITVRLEGSRGRFRKAWNGAREVADALRAQEELSNVDDLLRRHRILERQVWAADRVFQTSIRELRLNKLVEREADTILQRQVLDPLDQLYSGRLKTQREALEKAFRKEEVPLASLVERQDIIAKEMKKILDGMQRWDSFVDLINQLDEVISLQTNTRRATLGGEPEKDDAPDKGK